MKKEKTQIKKIGIWMDHAEARIMEPDASSDQIRLIHSSFNSRVRTAGAGSDGTQLGIYRSTNNESHKHNRKQEELHSYYKQLAEELESYDEIFIFGPSTAHNEFHNYLLKEKKFSDKKIVAESAAHTTENQMREAVRNFFDKHVKVH